MRARSVNDAQPSEHSSLMRSVPKSGGGGLVTKVTASRDTPTKSESQIGKKGDLYDSAFKQNARATPHDT